LFTCFGSCSLNLVRIVERQSHRSFPTPFCSIFKFLVSFKGCVVFFIFFLTSVDTATVIISKNVLISCIFWNSGDTSSNGKYTSWTEKMEKTSSSCNKFARDKSRISLSHNFHEPRTGI
jgi:hypothetical protein